MDLKQGPGLLAAMNKEILGLGLDNNGIPRYSVSLNNKQVIKPSGLDFRLNEGIALKSYFQIIKINSKLLDETWKPVLHV